MPPVGNGNRQYASPFGAILAQSFFIATVLMLTASSPYAFDQDQFAAIRSSILALDSARQTALHEHQTVPSTAAEAADYRDFIVYLNTRIASYCVELAEQGGASELEGLPCSAGQVVSGSDGSSAAAGQESIFTTLSETADARTQVEKTAELDGDFLATLGDFDEMLLKEESKVAARVPSQRESRTSAQDGGTGSNGSSGAGESGSQEPGSTGEGRTAAAGDEAADNQAGRSGTVAGTERTPGTGNGELSNSAYGVPGGRLPPPRDDDIVARQLREAAEKEPDPELKKKLWEEYWKYKGKRP
jgi:hypothetical protein